MGEPALKYKDEQTVSKPARRRPKAPPLKLHKTVTKKSYQPAGVNKRIIAFFLDGVLSLPLLIGFQMLVSQFLQDKIFIAIIPNLLLGITYAILPIFLFGKTLGKKIMGLEVIDYNGDKLKFHQVFLRETVAKGISMIPFFLGFIWFRFQKERRGWHDLMMKTMVVDINK